MQFRKKFTEKEFRGMSEKYRKRTEGEEKGTEEMKGGSGQ